jgi:hypothetical protein
MIKVTHLADVSAIKDGVGRDSKAWTLYKVVDVDGESYTTFNATPYFQALEQEAEITLQFDEEPVEKNGKTYVNRKLLDGKLAPKRPLQNFHVPSMIEKNNSTPYRKSDREFLLELKEDIDQWLQQ